jgi:hypothetical protein
LQFLFASFSLLPIIKEKEAGYIHLSCIVAFFNLKIYKSTNNRFKKHCFLKRWELKRRYTLSEFAIALTAIYRYMK